MVNLNKSDTTDHLDRIASKYEPKIEQGLLAAFEKIKSGIILSELEGLIVTGGISAVLAKLGDLEKIIGKEIRDTLIDAVAEGGRAVIGQLPKKAILETYTFDMLDQGVIREFKNHYVRLVSDISMGTRKVVVDQLEANIIAGVNPIKAARDIRDSIGLTQIQNQAVSNFRASLESGDISSALKNTLRDKRFDKLLSSAKKKDKPISQEKIDKMVDRYRERTLKYRAETVARTEAMRAISMGEFESLKQAYDEGSMQVELLRFWVATLDERTRWSHKGMPKLNKDGVGIDQPFKTPRGNLLRYPRDPNAPPEEVVNCRCRLIYKVV